MIRKNKKILLKVKKDTLNRVADSPLRVLFVIEVVVYMTLMLASAGWSVKLTGLARAHLLPLVTKRETVPVLRPRAHEITSELVRWEEPRANRAKARHRDMMTHKWLQEQDSLSDPETHARRRLHRKDPRLRLVMTSRWCPLHCLSENSRTLILIYTIIRLYRKSECNLKHSPVSAS